MFQVTQTIQLLTDDGVAVSDTRTLRDAQQPDGGQTVTRAPVTNRQVAEILITLAPMRETPQGNPNRIAAYQNAARGMMRPRTEAATLLARGERLETPGLGDRLRRKITELVTTGRLTFYDDLCEESLPSDVRELMTVAHIGPRIALRLTSHLGIHNVRQLWEATESHRLREHYGFGARSEQRLADAAYAALLARAASAQSADHLEPKVA